MPRKKDANAGSESVPVVEKRIDGAVPSKSEIEVDQRIHVQTTSNVHGQECEMNDEEKKRLFKKALKETMEKDKAILDALAKI
jgi:hypothetical protein